ncbi:hypothetical protein BKA59DRAFT_487406 [Fusarium tricinctum]|uniref:Uncharacterized protein n=1 Tax=Fusarium tricinctum TaxID=61284 RepID=A0A8K0W5M0_9HYPO|nr:hypothetical protein BKA59DRAFT_487406 [Fusarium tricinctum]
MLPCKLVKISLFTFQETGTLGRGRFQYPPLVWLFAELAKWYGAKGVEAPPTENGQYQQIMGKGGDECPLGHGPPTEINFTLKMVDWARDAKNQQAWQRIMESSNGKILV